jgi:hypothetical protein
MHAAQHLPGQGLLLGQVLPAAVSRNTTSGLPMRCLGVIGATART